MSTKKDGGMMVSSKVTVVIVNWNRKHDVIALLDCLLNLVYEKISVVLVDNASTDDSVAAIKGHPLKVFLVENSVNLGGTVGFNTGIRYALDHLQQDFVWLLDNDVLVTPYSLDQLVAAMEQDPSIALAGSRIVNQNDREAVVETGAYLSLKNGNVAALNRNVKNSALRDDVLDVDYVAVCSALVRANAIATVGLMDERYFLLWDDMDWGASFKRHGYRVVCALGSIVYHPAFTEKRSLVVDNYYGIRNPLLTISKHTKGFTRIQGLFNILGRAAGIASLFSLNGQKKAAGLCFQATRDFLTNAWGQVGALPSLENLHKCMTVPLSELYRKKVLVLPTGNGDEINCLGEMASDFRQNGGKLYLLIQKDRRELFEDKGFDEIIEFEADMISHPFLTIKSYLKIFRLNFDAAIKPSLSKVNLFSYAVRKVYVLADNKIETQKTREGLFALPAFLLLLSMLMIVIILVLPLFYIKSNQYYSQQEV